MSGHLRQHPSGHLLHGALGTSQHASLDAVVCRPGTGASLRVGAARRDSGAGSLGPLAGGPIMPGRSSRSCHRRHRCKGVSSQEHTCLHWLLDWHAVQGQTARMMVACTVWELSWGHAAVQKHATVPRVWASLLCCHHLSSSSKEHHGSRGRQHRHDRGFSKPQIWESLFRVLVTASLLCG